MKTKIITLLFVTVANVCAIFASEIKVINGIWYDLNRDDLSAKVTYRGSSYSSYYDEYSDIIIIPAIVYCEGNNYNVTGIGESAFRSCTSLTSITIPNSVTSIEDYAFYGCFRLTSIELPNSIINIGDYAFGNCSGITSIDIPISVTSIGSEAFSSCSSLTSIEIPNSITSIGRATFSGCSGITSIDIPNSVTCIGDYAFSNCSNLTSIEIPNSVTSIERNTFSGCSGLTSIEIPNSITSIGDYAFFGCSGLISIEFPNSITNIGKGTFYNCTSLTSFEIPNGVLNIDSDAFSGCSSLTSINIPNSVISIGSWAFENCIVLTSLTIGNSVDSIGVDAFLGCSKLTSVTLNSDAIVSKTYSSSSNFKSIFGSQVKQYILGEEVTSIGDYAFKGCSKLVSFIIPNNVQNIGAYAFKGCSNLTSIIIPNSVQNIGIYAFEGCNINKINFYGTLQEWCEKTWDPSSVSSEYNLFIEDELITNLVIPNSTTNIGHYAFSNCSSLTSIAIANSVTSIGSDAFSGCTGLTSVEISNSVTSIGTYTFYGCNGLTTVDIPNSVTSIGYGAFGQCSSMTSVSISNRLTHIGSHAFEYCESLLSLDIPNSVTNIADYAFNGCNSLTSVSIGNSITKIGEYAFYGCSSLTSMVIEAETPPTLDGYWGKWFDSRYLTSIYVPCGTRETYKMSEGWSNYASIIQELSPTYTITTNAPNGNVIVNRICSDVTLTVIPNDGYYFIQWSDGNKNNPRTIVLTQDTTLTAEFGILYSVSVQSADSRMGSAYFSDLLETQSLNYGQYPIGTNLIGKAQPNQGYRFTHWSDGIVANPRGITVESDINLRAFFDLVEPAEITYYTISVSSDNISMGTVSGGGQYEEGTTATVTATPKSGYKFTCWSNGSTANPYSFTVTNNVSLTAYFEQSSTPQPQSSKFWNISDDAFNSLGTITSTKTIDGLTIYATSSKNVVIDESSQVIDGLLFTHRLKLNGTGSSDARLLSFQVDGDCDIEVYLKSGSGSEDRTLNVDRGSFGTTFQQISASSSAISKGTVHYTGGATTIYLYSPSSSVSIYAIRVTLESTSQPMIYSVSVTANDTFMGSVSGGGQYEEGANATATATPSEGYSFTHWSDGSTANPYSFTVTSNVSLTAYFEQSSTPKPESSKFWNISDAAFNSLGTISSNRTINELTIYATSSKNVVIDESVQEIDGFLFTHRLKFSGTGAYNARLLSFQVDGDCDIDVYLKSGSGTEDRTINVDKGNFGSTLQQIPAYSSAISKGTVHYSGNATTIYLYSLSSGVNIYAIRVTYDNSTVNIENTYFVQKEHVQKIIRNGEILILRGDKTYTIQGQEVK